MDWLVGLVIGLNLVIHIWSAPRPFRTAGVQYSKIWPDAIVPYEISSEFNRIQRDKIRAVIIDLHQFSCVRFVPRDHTAKDYVYFTPGTGKKCSSFVGRIGIGKQTLQLGPHCFQRSTILHEMLHSLGFHHEHSRRDRDTYIRILWHNMHPNSSSHFKIQHMSEHMYWTEYDYSSIMHYDSTMGTGNGEPTILKKIWQEDYPDEQDDKDMRIKPATTLSLADAARLNLLYDCGPASLCIDLYPHCSKHQANWACYETPELMEMMCRMSCGWC